MLDQAVRDLLGRTRGEVIVPSDDGYEPAREAYNAMAMGRPAVIFRPTDLADVVAAVRWAAAAISRSGSEAAVTASPATRPRRERS